jgi:hypothetical protein
VRHVRSGQGTHQRFHCRSCNTTWTAAGVRGGLTASERTIAREHVERASLRALGRRHGASRTRVMKIVHRAARGVPTSFEIAQRFRPLWSGILVVDGKYVRVFDPLSAKLDRRALSEEERRRLNLKVWLCGIDAMTGDLPHYSLADEETKIDLVLFFRALKKIGYVLRVLVCDGNDHILEAARHVYGEGFLVQRCTRHFLEGLRRKAAEAGLSGEPATSALIALIQAIVEARTLEEAATRRTALRAKRLRHPFHRQIVAELERQLPTLATHLLHPGLFIPHTTNEIENLFRQLNLRLRSLGRFGRFRYANDYLNAWAFWRRTTPFTDCRGIRRKRNGKSPLELAGCRIPVDIDIFLPHKPTAN